MKWCETRQAAASGAARRHGIPPEADSPLRLTAALQEFEGSSRADSAHQGHGARRFWRWLRNVHTPKARTSPLVRAFGSWSEDEG